MANSTVVVLKILFLVLIARLATTRAQSTVTIARDSADSLEPLDRQANVESSEKSALDKPTESVDQALVIAQPTTARQTAEAFDRKRENEPQTQTQAPDESAEVEAKQVQRDERQTKAKVNAAELCYLANGGSSLTLTVNEATQVGAIIGQVDVNGDPSLENGNVDLVELSGGQENSGGGTASATTSAAASTANLSSSSRRQSGRAAKVGAAREARAATPANRLVGLVSEHPFAGHSGSFYSLVAGLTTSPASVATHTPASSAATASTPVVTLARGTKNLLLARPLDREAASEFGELASLLVNVRCSARGSNQRDSETIIPIRLLIMDANDQAPEFSSPNGYVVNVSETAPIGSLVSREIQALDLDSAGPFSTIHYKVLDDGSPGASLLAFPNPLEPALTLVGQLDYETLGASFTISVLAQDQGEPEPLSSQVQVQVNVIDFDDQNPKFLDDKYTLAADELDGASAQVGQLVTVHPRSLRARDGDRGINASILYSFDRPSHPSNSEDPMLAIERLLHLDPNTGDLRLIRQWPPGWPKTALTLVVRASQADNRDRYTLTTLTLLAPPDARSAHSLGDQVELSTSSSSASSLSSPLAPSAWPARDGRPLEGIQFAQDRLSVSVAENAALNERIARVRASYLPASTKSVTQSASNKQTATIGNEHQPSISYQILDDQSDSFAINSLGEISVRRTLDYEQRQEYKFRVLATYNKHSDICQLQVNVLNQNDNRPKFTQGSYTFHLTESRLRSPGKLIGLVQANDADLDDAISYSLVSARPTPTNNLTGDRHSSDPFEIDPASGQLRVRANVAQLNVSSPVQLTVRATDSLGSRSGQPNNSELARVTVHIAPQLLGRSINLEQQQPQSQLAQRTSDSDNAHKLFHSRSLSDGSAAAAPTSGGRRLSGGAQGGQRSSVATLMSSVQHMLVGGIGVADTPMPSALLLSGVLVVLACLLLALLAVMSVHLYRRRARQLLRRRHQLAAAAQLHRAHLSAGTTPSPRVQPGALSPNTARQAQQRPSSGSRQTRQLQLQHARPTSAVSGTPTNSTRAGDSPDRRPLSPMRTNDWPGALGSEQLRPTRLLSELSAGQTDRKTADGSQVSSLSNQQSLGRSYRSNATEDSSVIQCGHYNVVQTPDKLDQANLVEAAIERLVRGGQTNSSTNSDLDQHPRQAQAPTYRRLPINSLARQSRAAEDQQQQPQQQPQHQRQSPSKQTTDEISKRGQPDGLMALIRQPNRSTASALSPLVSASSPAIRWPAELPHRTKRLTWDDEDSSASANLGANCNPSEQDERASERHFLFSSACSPVQLLALDVNNLPVSGTLSRSPALADEPSESLLANQNNCFDYTIVQSSQFQVDAFASQLESHLQLTNANRATLSSQHLRHQQQQHLYQHQQPQQPHPHAIGRHLFVGANYANDVQAAQSPANQTDLSKQINMTAAIL